MIKLTMFLILCVFSCFLRAETLVVKAVVKSYRIDADQKHYRVILHRKQVTYKADEKTLPCLEYSLENKKEAKFVIDGMSIIDCKKI